MHLELDDVVERARNFPMEVLVEVVGSVLELVVSVVFLSFSNPLWKRGAEGEGEGEEGRHGGGGEGVWNGNVLYLDAV